MPMEINGPSVKKYSKIKSGVEVFAPIKMQQADAGKEYHTDVQVKLQNVLKLDISHTKAS